MVLKLLIFEIVTLIIITLYILYCVAQKPGRAFIECANIQGVLLPDRQTLKGDSRQDDKHY